MALLTAYSAGLAIPFLLTAVGVSRFLGFQRRIGPWLLPIQRVSGVILILLGILLMTGEFTRLAAALNRMTPEFLREWM
jgi:cytochrome c-type biogenesis protein